MTVAVPTVKKTMTIGGVREKIKKYMSDYKTIDYVFVVDGKNRLIGVLSIKEVFRQKDSTVVETIMTKEVVSVLPKSTQEHTAHLALKHNIKAVPVVDENNVFLGAVTNDTILTVLNREAREDILHLAGIHRAHAVDDIETIPLHRALEHRLPWLFLGLFGGIMAAHIIGAFETTLSQNIILAAFIPLIVYMADAVRIQVEAFVIRDLAVGHTVNYLHYFWKQLQIVLATAVLIGISLTVWSILRYDDIRIALVLGISLMTASATSVITGLLIPAIFSKLQNDPANASGPIGTIIQDMLSITIYFAMATWLL